MSLFRDVGEFHRKFDLPVASEAALLSGVDPNIPEEKVFDYRLNFLEEEMTELRRARAEGDLAEIADALADLVWVALGTAHYCGIPFDAVWAEVKRANMDKRKWREGDPVKPRARGGVSLASVEVIKPEGWRPPDVAGILLTWGYGS